MQDKPDDTKPTLSLRIFYGLFEVDASGKAPEYAALVTFGMVCAYKWFGMM
jgi:hypothetical protein